VSKVVEIEGQVDIVEIPILDEVTEEIIKMKSDISFLKSLVEDVTYDSLLKVIEYYEALLRMSRTERSSEVYGLTSTYALLLLNSTYDLAIKEIFRKTFGSALATQSNIQKYIGEIIDRKILNRYMTNIKHNKVVETFALINDGKDAKLLSSINIINELIKTRNNIAHGLETSSKGHNDLQVSLTSVIYYLQWYCSELLNRFEESSDSSEQI